MLGRDRELERLRAQLERARSGRSGAVLVQGEAGIGKSALLEAIGDEAASSGCTVLRATGVASESTMAWSGLAELTRPLVDDLRALPEVQSTALAAALALGPPATADRFTVGAATLSLLAAAAERAPVLVVVDDVQWLDADSADALLFAARRLSSEGVAVVVAVRAGVEQPHDLSWLERLEIGPLEPEAARQLVLLQAPGPIADDVATALVAAARGNALALVALPRLLDDDQRRGRASLPDPLPAPSSFEHDMARRLRTLPARAVRALTVAASHADGSIRVVEAALETLDLSLGDLEPAERRGVLRLGGGELSFNHPLLRSAAYIAAAPAERRVAHRALASALSEHDELEARARHLASATIGTDEPVARCLEAAASQARDRGALTIAADLAAKASAFSPDPTDRARRGIAAAEVALLGGRTNQVSALLDGLGPLDDPTLRVRAAHVRARWHVVAGGGRAGLTDLVTVADGAADDDPGGAALLYVHCAAAALAAGAHADAADLAERAWKLAGDAEPLASLVEMTAIAARVAAGGDDDGARLLALYERLGDDTSLLATGQPTLLAAATALIWLEDFDRAEQLVDGVVATARRRSAVGLLPLALVHQAWILIRRAKVAPAEAAASEALRLAETTGQSTVALVLSQMLAQIAVLRGRNDEARLLAAQVRLATDGRPMSPLRYNATMALAYAEMNTGRNDLAVTLLEEIVDASSTTPFFRNPAAFGAANHLIEAYIRVGREADARALLDAFADAAAGLAQPWPRGQVARLRGLLEDDYDGHFKTAVELLEPTASAAVWARVSWAERLRGDRRDAEAREQLHAAFALARRCGYHGHTAQILAALAALGEPAVGAPDELGRLSGRELAVATAVAGGATVPQAAAELFLSPQTVEHDLAAVCRVLGVTAPEDLAARLAGDGGAGSKVGWFISILGRCRVRRDGVDLPVPAGRAGTLLQLLATLGDRATLDEVIEHLWPEVDAEVGRTRIRNVLTRLRQSVGDIVRRQGELLTFADDVGVDATTFLAEATAALAEVVRDEPAAAERAAAALQWYGGSLLPEATYEPWATAPRGRLHARYVQLLDLLAEHAERLDRLEDAARDLELAVEAEPHDPDRPVAAAAVRVRQGRRSRAATLCRLARQRADDLGVPPPAAVEHLESEARNAG